MLHLCDGDVIGLIVFDLILRMAFARVMHVAFVVHLARMHPHDPTTDPASLGIPTHVIAGFECLCRILDGVSMIGLLGRSRFPFDLA
jgi:hypothetical protein